MERLDFVDDSDDIVPAGEFTVNGKGPWSVLPPEHIPYSLLRKMSAAADAATASNVAKAAGDEEKAQAEMVRAGSLLRIDDFFTNVLAPKDVESFLAFLDASDSGLSLGMLRDKVMPEVSRIAMGGAARPTTPSKPSRPGRKATGRTSGAGSSSRARTRAG